jgi:protein TonB
MYDVRVEKGLEATLDDNAVAAVRTWRFKPAEKDGKPVAVSVQIEVNFRLL